MQRQDTERYARLTAQVERPEAWKPRDTPDHPRTIAGEITAEDTVEGEDDYGKAWSCRVQTVKTPEGKEWGVWHWHTVLRNELEKATVGDFVALSYTGERTSKNTGGEYPHYRLAIEKNEHSGSDDELPPQF